MPITRNQAALQANNEKDNDIDMKPEKVVAAGKNLKKRGARRADGEPPVKKAKREESIQTGGASEFKPQTGIIERGHIYFFYRPKVQMEGASSMNDVKNFHMLLVPRPPEFSTHIRKPDQGKVDKEENEEAGIKVLSAGADAVPAPATQGEYTKQYRLITIGKKRLPGAKPGGKGKGHKQTFWADVTSLGDDLHSLAKGLGKETYETKTKGTRHNEPARLAARGAYAFVNNEPRVRSQRTTHFGYHISHPATLGSVQKDLGISKSSSFVVQVRNPLAPPMNPRQAHAKGADYPEWIMQNVFGKWGEKGRKGRKPYGLKFASCETQDMLDYVGTQLLLIAAREGVEGVDTSLGEGRGKALEEAEEKESDETVEKVFRELGLDLEIFSAESLEGKWI